MIRDLFRALVGENVADRIRRESLARLVHTPRRTHLDAVTDVQGSTAGRDSWAHHLDTQRRRARGRTQ